ncbi:hypothetical protein [Acinetobacter baumannii]|nr:hypothetical protein [Acinetobacter baumannii]MDN8280122.1 hypothetical protein [Acinetobacter baumannii]
MSPCSISIGVLSKTTNSFASKPNPNDSAISSTRSVRSTDVLYRTSML